MVGWGFGLGFSSFKLSRNGFGGLRCGASWELVRLTLSLRVHVHSESCIYVFGASTHSTAFGQAGSDQETSSVPYCEYDDYDYDYHY